MSDIEIRHLTKAFGEKVVFHDFSVILPEGKTTCIMGPSGCGKTTLMKILLGLEKPDAGEILFETENISYVFQENRLSENYSAVSNIKFITGKSLPKALIVEKLEAFGLGKDYDKPVRTLSGGMKRRVALARALCVPFEVLIMDEPFKGLDERSKASVMGIVKQETEGKTVICITHDPKEAEFMGNRIVNMEKEW